jgi:hypothetical protein
MCSRWLTSSRQDRTLLSDCGSVIGVIRQYFHISKAKEKQRKGEKRKRKKNKRKA